MLFWVYHKACAVCNISDITTCALDCVAIFFLKREFGTHEIQEKYCNNVYNIGIYNSFN